MSLDKSVYLSFTNNLTQKPLLSLCGLGVTKKFDFLAGCVVFCQGSETTKVMENKRKIVRSTKSQLKILTDYMATHRAFANNEYTGPLGNAKYLSEWEDLRNVLREHGPDKSVEQWRHTWRDIKKKARNEMATARRASGQTGNKIDIPVVSDSALQVLDTIGQECAIGIGGAESEIGNMEIGTVPPPAEFVDVQEIHRPSTSGPPSGGHDYARAGPSQILPTSRTTMRPRPTPGVAQKRRTGFGGRAKEFLKAEDDTRNVLKDILNQMVTQSKLMVEYNELLKKHISKKDNIEEKLLFEKKNNHTLLSRV